MQHFLLPWHSHGSPFLLSRRRNSRRRIESTLKSPDCAATRDRLCALFSSATDFPKKTDKAVAQAKSDISNGHAVCEFAGIASGTYAVSVFHDENSNGKLDTNIMGIPREGVGASNNARGHFGPPKFAAAAFPFSGGRIDLKITINYL